MLGSNVLEVGIGLVFLYLLGSLICSSVNELISGMMSWRAKTLERGLRNLLDGNTSTADGWARKLLAHPLIDGLGANNAPPSYVPARTFSTALLSLILDSSGEGATVDLQFLNGADAFNALRAKAKEVPNPVLQRALLPLIESARHAWDGKSSEVDAVKSQLETWFNDSMDRVGGWYKRRTQLVILILSIIGAMLLNIDTIAIAQRLGSDSLLRAQLASDATGFQKTYLPASGAAPDPAAKSGDPRSAVRALDQLQFPIGWTFGPETGSGGDSLTSIWKDSSRWVPKLLGLLLTAGAMSFGAPFWFDILTRFISLRSTGSLPALVPKPAAPAKEPETTRK